MKEFCLKIKNIILNPVWAMYIMLVVSYLSQIRIFYEYLGIVRRGILFWGGILLIYSVLRNYKIYINKYSIVLMLFCVSNCISVLLNYSDRFFYGIVTMVYVCLYLLVFFNVTRWSNENYRKKVQIEKNILNINIVFPFVFCLVALIMFVFNVQGKYISGSDTIYYGMRENRLWGVYNPNTAASICIISIVSSLIQLKKSKYRKFLIGNIVIQLIYLILTQSRTGWILLIVFSVLYLLFQRILPVFRSEIKFGRKLLNVVCSVGILIGLWICPTAAKEVLVKIPQAVSYIMETGNPEWGGKDVSLDRIDEEYVNQQDITNGRTELWKAGIEIVKDNPIFGIGSENIINEAEQYLSEDRYRNLVKGGFHNSYLAIMVSSGIVGVLLFGVFLLMLVIDGVKYLWRSGEYRYSLIIMLLFTLMVNELMEARWLYNTSYLNIIFWILAGFAVNRIEGVREK